MHEDNCIVLVMIQYELSYLRIVKFMINVLFILNSTWINIIMNGWFSLLA